MRSNARDIILMIIIPIFDQIPAAVIRIAADNS